MIDGTRPQATMTPLIAPMKPPMATAKSTATIGMMLLSPAMVVPTK